MDNFIDWVVIARKSCNIYWHDHFRSIGDCRPYFFRIYSEVVFHIYHHGSTATVENCQSGCAVGICRNNHLIPFLDSEPLHDQDRSGSPRVDAQCIGNTGQSAYFLFQRLYFRAGCNPSGLKCIHHFGDHIIVNIRR
ncbi:hypothetical protein SDC9_170776 [bioreactor metagenome]|uniref:Uncharacterized protein n=1 Tax=bioreactor metagenome TaxID=1076179 RepID=A0A645G913_9ZZZZ